MGSLASQTLPTGLKACSLPLMFRPAVLAPAGSLSWHKALALFLAALPQRLTGLLGSYMTAERELLPPRTEHSYPCRHPAPTHAPALVSQSQHLADTCVLSPLLLVRTVPCTHPAVTHGSGRLKTHPPAGRPTQGSPETLGQCGQLRRSWWEGASHQTQTSYGVGRGRNPEKTVPLRGEPQCGRV